MLKSCSATLDHLNDPDEFLNKGSIIIEDDVWIGANSVILAGVKIGRGAIVAAGSIVAKDVEPYSIVGGNPAKKIRLRFDQEVINRLEEIQWWNWDDLKIKENKLFFIQNFKNK